MVTDVAPGVPEEMDEMTGAELSVAAVDAVELVWLPEPPPPRLRDAIGVAFAEWVVGVAEEVTVVAGGVVVVPVVLMCVSLLCFLCSTRSRISLSALSLQSLLCSIRSRMGLILFVSLVLVVAIKSPVAATCGTEMGGVRIDTMSPSVKKRTPSSRERERERERESLRERSIDGGIVEIIWEFPNIIQRFFMCHPFESSWKSPGNGQPFGSAAAAGRATFCGRRRSFSSIPPAGRSFSEGRFEFCSAIAANLRAPALRLAGQNTRLFLMYVAQVVPRSSMSVASRAQGGYTDLPCGMFTFSEATKMATRMLVPPIIFSVVWNSMNMENVFQH